MAFTRAIVRRPGPDFGAGLTTADLGEPDPALMLAQHGAYVSALGEAGLAVEVLDAAPGFPDAHFVEDVAVVTPELAVITRPGAASRRGETALIETALAAHRPLAHIEAPGTMDGGDVLEVGKTLIVGLSARTNEAGARQLGRLLAPQGYEVVTLPVEATLHFKSDVNWLGDDTLVVTEAFARAPQLAPYRKVVLPPEDAYAANCVRVNDRLLLAEGFPRARAMLEALDLGMDLVALPVSECRKMDGGLTCLSLRF